MHRSVPREGLNPLRPSGEEARAGAGGWAGDDSESLLAALSAPKGGERSVKRPPPFLDYTQAELDAAYDQAVYQPNIQQLRDRWASNMSGPGPVGPPCVVLTAG